MSGRERSRAYRVLERSGIEKDIRMLKHFKRLRRGFTLVEIMIVVLIIGILLAIAIPNFVKAREQARAKACSKNLFTLDEVTQMYAIDNRVASAGTGPTLAQLVGTTSYIRSTPFCPSNGAYSLPSSSINNDWICSSTTPAYPHTFNGS